MKSHFPTGIVVACQVAPCAGAWIEMALSRRGRYALQVAPCAGAWIEMVPVAICVPSVYRRPLRGGVD